jgi:hypothetical protein
LRGLVLIEVDGGVDGRGIDHALLDQQRFERLHAQRDLGGHGLMVVRVILSRRLLRTDNAGHEGARPGGCALQKLAPIESIFSGSCHPALLRTMQHTP